MRRSAVEGEHNTRTSCPSPRATLHVGDDRRHPIVERDGCPAVACRARDCAAPVIRPHEDHGCVDSPESGRIVHGQRRRARTDQRGVDVIGVEQLGHRDRVLERTLVSGPRVSTESLQAVQAGEVRVEQLEVQREAGEQLLFVEGQRVGIKTRSEFVPRGAASIVREDRGAHDQKISVRRRVRRREQHHRCLITSTVQSLRIASSGKALRHWNKPPSPVAMRAGMVVSVVAHASGSMSSALRSQSAGPPGHGSRVEDGVRPLVRSSSSALTRVTVAAGSK